MCLLKKNTIKPKYSLHKQQSSQNLSLLKNLRQEDIKIMMGIAILIAIFIIAVALAISCQSPYNMTWA